MYYTFSFSNCLSPYQPWLCIRIPWKVFKNQYSVFKTSSLTTVIGSLVLRPQRYYSSQARIKEYEFMIVCFRRS